MGVKARYSAQMIVLARPEQAGEVNAYAVKSNIPKSELLRTALFETGWPNLKRKLRDEYGALTATERYYGILAALPPAERDAYARLHKLDWDSPLCQVSRTGAGRPMLRPAAPEPEPVSAGAE